MPWQEAGPAAGAESSGSGIAWGKRRCRNTARVAIEVPPEAWTLVKQRNDDGRESSKTPDQASRQSIDVQQKALSRPVPCPPHCQTAIPAMRLKRHCFIASWPELAGSHPVSSGRHGTHTKSRRDYRCHSNVAAPQSKVVEPGCTVARRTGRLFSCFSVHRATKV